MTSIESLKAQTDNSSYRPAVHVITLPMRRPPMTSNDQRRMHWTKVRKLKAEAAEQVGWRAREQLQKGLRIDRARVRITWYAPDARRRDSDALGPFLKAALDALVSAGVLPDDHSAHVVETSQRILVDRSNPRITIAIRDLDAVEQAQTRPSAAVEPPMAAPVISGEGSSSASVSADSRLPRREDGAATPGTDGRAVQVVSSQRRRQSPRTTVSPRPTRMKVETPSPAPAAGVGSSGRVPAVRDNRHCVVCGGPITQPGTGRPRKTCSGRCRMRHSRLEGKKDMGGKKVSGSTAA